ncbi:MAG: alpha-1,4-glucan--maltose-1-phosphate maltosyltransferase [Chloroflexi bacterium]|nr:alpha-1,4-glucan--maltose-1-phosphate maltosyltransferase [Chloroflexota bacterium]
MTAGQGGVPDDGRRRVVIEAVTPSVDGGRFAIKRVVGDVVRVEADCFADGHDEIAVRLLWRAEHEPEWSSVSMTPHAHGNDRWTASFTAQRMGRYSYTVEGWVDRFATWVRDMRRRREAGQDVAVELRIGAALVAAAMARAAGEPSDEERLRGWAIRLADGAVDQAMRSALALDPALLETMERYPDRSHATRFERELALVVDRERARFSSWYELFPRSTSPDVERAGTLRDVIDRLPYVAGMGFDVLYLPPIHPIGTAFRKGADNALEARPGDPGVPWAIGSSDGGHTAIHAGLGTLDDFRALVSAARGHGLELALDIAFQASPDHPWVAEHPGWFRQRPDGTIQYAENPPKKYQDIYPFDFETNDWPALWDALRDVMAFWAAEGVRVFRVDNPHTKSFAFWEWAIGQLKARFPDLILLAEAFTRPKVMYRLAKLGFSQSYTYFTWRTTRSELTDYLMEVSQPPVSESFRPNLWTNTPDILHETLQLGGRPMFEARVILAATLAASYGIYGPAYELMEAAPREPGSEEYLHSEKYQVRHWDGHPSDSLSGLITTLNRIRRDHPALQSNERLEFHEVDDDQLLAYSKRSIDGQDTVLVVVNLDPARSRRGTVSLPLERWQMDPAGPFQAHDLLTGLTYTWRGQENRVRLVPGKAQAHILALRPLGITVALESDR